MVELLVVIAIIGTLVGLLLPAIQATRESARQSTCRNNLKQWAHAMHLHHHANNFFPYHGQRLNDPEKNTQPGMNQRRSFVVPLWCYTEMISFYNQFNQNVSFVDQNSPAVTGGQTNSQLVQTPVPLYYCPSDRPGAKCLFSTPPGIPWRQAKGNYLVNIGPDQYYSPGKRAAPFGVKNGGGTNSYVPYRTSLAHITDGSSNTLLMSEGTFSPGDTDDDTRIISINDASCVFNATAPPNSGTDKYLNGQCFSSLDPTMPCVQVGDDFTQWQIIARSRHRGGVNASFCDGAVQFIPDSIDTGVWQELSTMKSGNSVGAWQ